MPKKNDALKEYKAKRDFSKTPEPVSAVSTKKSKSSKKLRQTSAPGGLKGKGMRFVVQKHAASHLHYDFRLEIDGVLASWAIPKGPSLDPADKRLAVMTEDHPLEYARFEGVIPAGEYGGGTVMVWDTGTYENIKEVKGKLVSMDQCLKNGRIEIVLQGKKLHGAYALVRFKGEKKQWLLIKMKDAYAKAGTDITESKPKSAVTGRTMEQITHAGVLFDGDSPCAYPGRQARQASADTVQQKGKVKEKNNAKAKSKTKRAKKS